MSSNALISKSLARQLCCPAALPHDGGLQHQADTIVTERPPDEEMHSRLSVVLILKS